MKRILKFMGLTALLLSLNTQTVTAQTAVNKGDFIIDPYYGFPNFGGTLATIISDEININPGTGVGVSEPRLFGPAGLRAEYMIADKFGLGFDFIFNSAAVDGTVDSLNNNGGVVQTYDVTGFGRRFRFQIRANYHFLEDENFDAYVGFGAGTNIRTFGVKTDFPNYENIGASGALIPFSLRLALGTRYYFTDNLGLNLELGLGGPVISAGLSLKF